MARALIKQLRIIQRNCKEIAKNKELTYKQNFFVAANGEDVIFQISSNHFSFARHSWNDERTRKHYTVYKLTIIFRVLTIR